MRAAPPSEDSNDAVHRRFLKESPAMFKDGVMEVSKDNEIAYSEVAKVSPAVFTVFRIPIGSGVGFGFAGPVDPAKASEKYQQRKK
jgi:hypothetical protein